MKLISQVKPRHRTKHLSLSGWYATQQKISETLIFINSKAENRGAITRKLLEENDNSWTSKNARLKREQKTHNLRNQ